MNILDGPASRPLGTSKEWEETGQLAAGLKGRAYADGGVSSQIDPEVF